MDAPVRFGLKHGGQDTTTDELRAVWRIADEAGFDHLWCLDLFAPIREGSPDRPVFEGWALQAAMATATTRVRIGATFTGNTHRPPWMLAKLAVTVDHLSGGRLEFGIGAGYEPKSHAMYDISLEHRVGRLSESLQILKRLWTEERVTFEGRHYKLRDAIASPKPVQKPHPPIWIGAGGEQMVRVAARHADVWNGGGGTLMLSNRDFVEAAGKKLLAGSRALDEDCLKIGRDPETIRRCVQFMWDGKDRGVLLDASARWLEEGFREQIVYIEPPGGARTAEAAAALLTDLRKIALAAA